ncbi:U3 snoRNP-associated protein Utp1 [Taphrina deformans PYCC 5710]|uniref:U3 snoRNP-associated protein Utp1 n=1 Tax=Taphrina deformans (strain PYCC 5710 / ATCC 11124 / CBS 356.35 / IMI 108563 / JCM 9778 / NBRC 8474) TaxID=1097556 RepID=R4XIG1_TAPDE|nr:U3 snoRNP-associated protein Utp1 [Taphrina deformans PYCC 5710]|eukprot:CCG83142.1 U3 snoRNP-associated protein Utp1 [Taphrina deformans PYCC 5710]
MKSDFRFSNLLGTVYSRGNLVFTPDGNSLLTPVGNRVSHFDLVNGTTFTFPFETRKNIARLALSPLSTLLIAIDEDGHAVLVNFVRRTVLHHFNFKEPVREIQFAPDGKHFVVAVGKYVQAWRTPSYTEDRDFAPFVKHRVYTGHYDNVTSITWSKDSRFFLTASTDLTARIYSLDPEEGFVATTLGGHRDAVIDAYFSSDQETIYTVSKDGALFRWSYQPLYNATEIADSIHTEDKNAADRKHRWIILDRHYFNQTPAKTKCSTFHPENNLLVAGFSNGIFAIYDLSEDGFAMIHTLSISQNAIDCVTINKTGEWLAFGASKLGQLLVWEWQSESYILKQQGHFDAMNCVTYSPDGQRVVTASEDGKIKVWDIRSGFCLVTFTDHTSAITDIHFAKKGNVLFSASLDGSIRAWDLVRYRNFRTFTAAERVQFSCLAVDPSGEIVCAGSTDSYDIYMWSVQTGQLIDTLSAHEGPVCSLHFAGEGGVLASGSWDKTVRIWNVFSRKVTVEPLNLSIEIQTVAFRPDGKEICVATLDGQLSFWDVTEAQQTTVIDGRRDISGGRRPDDRMTAANNINSKSFRSVCYTADGSAILASGNSKYICIYDVQTSSLLRKYQISQNLSLVGTQEKLNSKNLTEAGPLELIDQAAELSDDEERRAETMPGASRGDKSIRRLRPEIRTKAIKFSPTGRSFAAASTEGLLVYSLDQGVAFDPFDLDLEVTPTTIRQTLTSGEYLKALVMAFRLNEKYLVHTVFEAIPGPDISLVARDLPVIYLSRMLRFIAMDDEASPHIEFHLLWIQALMSAHGSYIRSRTHEFSAELRAVQKSLARVEKDLVTLSDHNKYSLDYILSRRNDASKSTKVIDMAFEDNALNGGEQDQEMMDGEEGEEEFAGFASD